MASPLPASIPATHAAIAVTVPGTPLHLTTLPTVPPSTNEALIHVTHTASTPLNLHRAVGGLMLDNAGGTKPFILGSSYGGTVVALGPSTTTTLSVGDKVFGTVQDGAEKEAGFQEYVTVPTWRVSKLPAGMTLEEGVTVPTNLVTAVHTVVADLGLELPWPVPAGGEWVPRQRDEVVLVWGAASSVGQYVLQVLRHWGYRHVLAVAGGKHHESLRGLGARECFDYRGENVVGEILGYLDKVEVEGGGRSRVPYIVDCIGSLEGTLRPLSKIAEKGSKVAVMLPVINVHAGQDREPELEMDVNKALPGQWKEGVELRGVRTHFYYKNEFLKNHLQPEIIPALLAQGVVQPNKQRVVEGKTMLERAQKALDLLRDQAVSGEKLVWRLADEEI
ncbi:chaperonin 10-like protein [Parachaetomium inaequale]|uniref:Chaperonin 10-like protein n=1 Tax=Parachaetomium inaequale TaxID=2588326 RepID=A0AAN6PD08_9PEZI|nr:chaperonin 10-like protein [Parachaetomium inaequale]